MRIVDFFCHGRRLRQSLEGSRRRLYRMALAWCGDEALADDLVQETLERALRNQHQLKDPDKLDSWMFSILANCWREHLRRLRPSEPLNEEALVERQGPERLHQRLDTISRVRDEIARLPSGQRQTLSLVDLEGFSYAETAEILEVPIGTVMSRLSRARGALRAQLRDLHEPVAAASPPRLQRVK